MSGVHNAASTFSSDAFRKRRTEVSADVDSQEVPIGFDGQAIAQGSDAANLKLSQKRADSVMAA